MEYRAFTLRKKYKPVIDNWIDILRSGDYKQATGQLYDGVGYCCLGVYCTTLLDGLEYLEHHGAEGFVCDGLFIEHDNAVPKLLGQGDLTEYLGALNDGDIVGIPKHSFNKIADYLEKYIKYE